MHKFLKIKMEKLKRKSSFEKINSKLLDLQTCKRNMIAYFNMPITSCPIAAFKKVDLMILFDFLTFY